MSFTSILSGQIQRVQKNWKSGLTVALVSIPLSISLAIASGATPIMGIITAVWAGIIAGLFGGSNFNIVGPAGALSGILAAYTLVHGYATIPMLALCAGVFILVATVLRLERFLVFIPGSTMHGFTLGVALIIGLGQLNAGFGLLGLPTHEKFYLNLFETFRHLADISTATTGVFVCFLLALFILAKFAPKVPGAIVLAPAGILLGFLTSNHYVPLTIQTLGQKFQGVTATLFELPSLHISVPILVGAVTIAFVAILETMISARIADGMTKTFYHERKEMIGLGLANIASGFAGGLPATGVLVRTALNIKSGANHKIAQVLNGVFVAIISIALLRFFNYIPMAVIAAILVFVSIRMVSAEHFVELWRHDKSAFFVALAVAGITVFEDPVVGILFGTAVALALFVERISHGQFEAIVTNKDMSIATVTDERQLLELEERYRVLTYSIKGYLVYINGQAHLQRFRNGSLDKYETVILRLRELTFIDLDGVDALDVIIDLVLEKKKKLFLTGVSPAMAKILEENSENYRNLINQGLLFPHTADVLKRLSIEPSPIS